MLTRRNNQNWMTNFFDDFFNNGEMMRLSSTAPAINVKEDEHNYKMEFSAPGIRKEFCRIHVNDEGHLVVNIENKMEHKDENKHEHYLRREFSYTNYEQTFALPETVDKQNIEACVDSGILTITLPKLKPQETTKVKQLIEVK